MVDGREDARLELLAGEGRQLHPAGASSLRSCSIVVRIRAVVSQGPGWRFVTGSSAEARSRRLAQPRRERVRQLARAAAASASSRRPDRGGSCGRRSRGPRTSCAGTIASERAATRRSSDQPPVRLARVEPVAARASARILRNQPTRRVRVVRRRVDDLRSRGGSRAGAGSAAAAEGPEEHDHAREAELVAKRGHGGRDHAEVLGDQRQRRRAPRSAASEELARRGPAASGRCSPSCAPAGTAQYETKPRKWSIRAQVEELERAAQALDPPAVALLARARASRRAGCPRAARRR